MNIAIVGAPGNVGRKLLEVLEKLNFKFDQLYLIASDKSIGKKVSFKNKEYSLVGLNDFDFSKVTEKSRDNHTLYILKTK